eukprot:CCRYP_005424-RC/>CCRYP_005424-RC protein AED:0.04 eAED:0.04 QI:48/1/0.90/1/0.2/0.18/11/4874/861
MTSCPPTTTPKVSRDAVSFSVSSDWQVEFHAFSSQEREHHHLHHPPVNASVAGPSAAVPTSSSSNGRHASDNTDSLFNIEGVLLTRLPLSKLFNADEAREALASFVIGGQRDAGMARGARVALADYAARSLSTLLPLTWPPNDGVENSSNADASRYISDPVSLTIKTMGQAKQSQSKMKNHRSSPRRARKMRAGKKDAEIPFVLERTDCIIYSDKHQERNEGVLQFYLHVDAVIRSANLGGTQTHFMDGIKKSLIDSMTQIFHRLKGMLTSRECFGHIATVVLQRQLRSMLQPPRDFNSSVRNIHGNDTSSTNNGEAATVDNDNGKTYLNAVAFIADNSILPRKSGRSCQPMSSPPAIPFTSPESDMLTRVVQVEVGYWRRFLQKDGTLLHPDDDNNDTIMESTEESAHNATTVSIRGMIIPVGVTLIVGGGYHGKSTLLQALSAGIYDKVPKDGRERCVTHGDALSIRAEDGRYVNRCNVSAFISNLPGSGLDTSRFSTMDASGSTSQAANVVEALESGASALLVDEDVSAANFMARDGRMRAMIMDEPITPLLYRVNGLFLSKEHNVSTVVVVGGVGEWLDVADAVVLMKDYVAYDGLKKARSVSYQFSYGHVQYAGRGVVHRLPWEVKEEKKLNAGEPEETGDEKKQVTLSPLRRKPETACLMGKFHSVAVHLLDSGSSRLWFYPDDDGSNSTLDDCDNDDDDGIVDMSKCSQLVGNASEQLYGCGICILWLLRESMNNPEDDMLDLLTRLEATLSDCGMNGLLISLHKDLGKDEDSSTKDDLSKIVLSNAAHDLWEDVGFALRPRVHEVAMTLTRMRGLRFEILPEKTSQMVVSSEEEEQKKKMAALAELWSNRRKK